MREILFRGKTAGGEWIEGFPMVFTDNFVQMCNPFIHNKTVYPETVGQFTGLTDKNGTKIFEGDIVKHSIGTFVVKYLDGMFCCSCIEAEYLTNLSSLSNACEVIGNIHDNPELLKD